MSATTPAPSPRLVAEGDQLVADALDLAEQVFALCTRQRMHNDEVCVEVPRGLPGPREDELLESFAEATGSQAAWEIIHAIQSYCCGVTSSAADRVPPLPSELRRRIGGAR